VGSCKHGNETSGSIIFWYLCGWTTVGFSRTQHHGVHQLAFSTTTTDYSKTCACWPPLVSCKCGKLKWMVDSHNILSKIPVLTRQWLHATNRWTY
jgi:hypothetical protein